VLDGLAWRYDQSRFVVELKNGKRLIISKRSRAAAVGRNGGRDGSKTGHPAQKPCSVLFYFATANSRGDDLLRKLNPFNFRKLRCRRRAVLIARTHQLEQLQSVPLRLPEF
jgi:hypothetical protein